MGTWWHGTVDEETVVSTFDKREDAFEKKFVHDEELHFRARARRNKQLALWAAGKLGKTGTSADSYVSDFVAGAVVEPADGGLFNKIRSDFDAAGVQQSDHQILRTMDEMLAQCVADVKASG